MKIPKRLFWPLAGGRLGVEDMIPAKYPKRVPPWGAAPIRPVAGALKRSMWLPDPLPSRFPLPKQFSHWMQRVRATRTGFDASVKRHPSRRVWFVSNATWVDCRLSGLYCTRYGENAVVEMKGPIPQSFRELCETVTSLRVAVVLAE